MSTDATEFNPYYKWLGIPPSDQPANHYRLLGLALYESDPDVIAAAADRQMAHVKSFAAGRYAAHSQLLLNELSKARVCLLNPNLKPIYDAQLTKIREKEREELIAVVRNAQPVTPPQDREVVVEAPAPKPSDSVQALESLAVPIRSTVRRRRRRSPMLLNFFVILAGGIVVAGLLWYAKVTGPPVAEANVTQDEKPDLGPEPIQETEEKERTPPPQVDEPGPRNIRPPDNDQQTQPDRSVRQPERVSEREETPTRLFDNPFAKMPTEVALPAVGAGPIDLGQYSPEIAASELRLDLVSPDYLTRANKRLFVHKHRETDEEVRWLVFDEPEPVIRAIQSEGDTDGTTPNAMLRAVEGKLSFAWLPDADSQEHAERLQQCVACLSMGDTTHKLQLRKPVDESSAIVIDNWDEKHEFQIPIEAIPYCPPPAEVLLRLHLLDGWPRSQPVNGNAERLAADERLLLSFSHLDYAGLGLYWEAKGKVIVVNVAPGFRLASYPDELQILSRTRLERAEKRLDRDKREAAREYSRRIKLRPRLSSNLETARNINITLPGGGTTVQLRNQKNAAISAAQTEINANEARITALNQLATLVAEDEKTRIPSLRSLAHQLEGTAKLGFELYTTVGNSEVVIYRKGIADLASSKEASHDARSLSTQSAPGSNHPLSSSGL